MLNLILVGFWLLLQCSNYGLHGDIQIVVFRITGKELVQVTKTNPWHEHQPSSLSYNFG